MRGMAGELEGRVAFVTGGSRGIGRACALALAKAGANVTISYVGNEAAAEEAVAAIEAAGGKGTALRLDVSDANAVRDAIEGIIQEQGSLHILIANAGISIDGLLMRYKDEDLEKLFRTNVFGAFYCARAASRAMMKARWGRIVFLGSVVGEMGNGGQSAYAATKSALSGMARSLARELASRNITVNVVSPGFIDTDMTRALGEQQKAKLVETIPLGCVGSPEDVANAVSFIASDRAAYVTGTVLDVNGGLYM